MKYIYLVYPHTRVQLPPVPPGTEQPWGGGQMVLWVSCTPRALLAPSPTCFHLFFQPHLASPAPARHSHGSDIIIYWFK